MTINDYTVVTARGSNTDRALEKLATAVKSLLSEGWQPTGGITVERFVRPVSGGMETEVLCCQPVVR
jgi:hypothetical protein